MNNYLRTPIITPPKCEKWLPIKGYEGFYEVSNLGQVKSVDRVLETMRGPMRFKSKVLKQQFNKDTKYFEVTLSLLGNKKITTIHRLVADAFIFNPNPEELVQVNHKNEVRTDNWSTNLEWCTPTYNLNYGHRSENHSKSMVEFYASGKGDHIKELVGKRGSEFFKKYNEEHKEELKERAKKLHTSK